MTSFPKSASARAVSFAWLRRSLALLAGSAAGLWHTTHGGELALAIAQGFMIAAAVTLGIGVFERRWTHREPIDAPLSRRTSNLPMLAVATASLAAATQLVGNIHGPGMLIASFLLLGLAVFLCVVVGLRSSKFLRTRRSPTDA